LDVVARRARAGDQRLHEHGGGTTAAPGGTTASGVAAGPSDLTRALLAIEQGPRYQQSDWGYLVLDQNTGEVLASQSPVRMFDAGSTMKTFAVSAALEHYGNDYVFRTLASLPDSGYRTQ
jgi:D-alanyl-D-alanine carboxypeptidase